MVGLAKRSQRVVGEAIDRTQLWAGGASAPVTTQVRGDAANVRMMAAKMIDLEEERLTGEREAVQEENSRRCRLIGRGASGVPAHRHAVRGLRSAAHPSVIEPRHTTSRVPRTVFESEAAPPRRDEAKQAFSDAGGGDSVRVHRTKGNRSTTTLRLRGKHIVRVQHAWRIEKEGGLQVGDLAEQLAAKFQVSAPDDDASADMPDGAKPGAAAGTDDARAAADPVLTRLAGVIEQATGVSPAHITRTTRLREDHDVDSLSLIELTVRAEQEFGVRLERNTVADFDTVGDAADYLAAHGAG